MDECHLFGARRVERLLGDDVDDFVRRARFQLQPQRRRAADVDDQAYLVERRETGLLHSRRVLADRQRRRAELSGIAGGQLSHQSGTGVGDRDGRAGDDRAVRIGDRPADRAGTELRLSEGCRRRRRQADDADQDGDYITHGRSPPGNQLIFQFLEMILWNKKRSLNQACKVAVSSGSIAC